MPAVDENAPATPKPKDPAPLRTCGACSATMQTDQDWCLSCGTAAPGRLGGRPGWRTVNAVAALTLVLVTGAVAASYAALSGDASTKAAQDPPVNVAPIPGQVAQVPDAPAPVAPTPPLTVPPTTGATPKVPTTPGSLFPPGGTLTPPATPSAVPGAPPIPVVPITPITPGPTTPDPTPPVSTTKPKTTTTTPKPSTTTTPTTTDDKKPVTPAAPAIKTVELAADAVDKYDPAKRITRSGNPAAAHDGNKMTAWSVTTPDDTFPMQVGLLVDLKSPTSVKQINLTTTTPGGRVELYGAAGSALPPDILDTRWEHVGSRSKLDQTSVLGNVPDDKQEKIRLLQGGGRFRYVLVWFTTPPKATPTVRISELELLG